MIVFISIALVNIDSLLEKFIHEELNRIIKSSNHQIYEFNYKNVDFHVWNGSFEISGIKISPKGGMLDSVKNGTQKSLVTAKLNTLSVIGFSFMEFYQTKMIKIEEIRIIDSKINVLFNPKVKIKKKTFDLSTLLTKKLRSINIDKLNFQNVDFDFNNVLRKNLLLEIDSMNMTIDNLVFDSISIENTIPISYKGINLFINKISANVSKYYMMETGYFRFNSEEKLLKINSIKLIPKYTVAEFHKIIPHEKTYLKITTRKLQISGIDIDSIRNTKKIYLDKILIQSPNIYSYKNKRINDPPYKYKKLLSQLIREIPIDFKIDTLEVINGNIKLHSLSNKVHQTQASEIIFKTVSLRVLNLINDSVFEEKKPIIKIDFNAQFMGVANLKANISMPIFNTMNSFYVKGQLAKMDAKVLSPLLEKLLLVHIKSGIIRSIDFDFKADNDSAIGYVDISYHNLKVDIKSNKDPRKSMKFINLLVNTIAKTDNIKNTPNFTRGFIAIKRDYNKKFINYLWLSLQNGILNTFRPNKKVKSQSKEFKKGNKLFERRKK